MVVTRGRAVVGCGLFGATGCDVLVPTGALLGVLVPILVGGSG